MTDPTNPARRAALLRMLEDYEQEWVTLWWHIERGEAKNMQADGLIVRPDDEPEHWTLTPLGLAAARAEREKGG